MVGVFAYEGFDQKKLNDNQLLKPVRFEDEIAFLDKYGDELFIDYLREERL